MPQTPEDLVYSTVKNRKMVWLSKFPLPFKNLSLLLGEDTAKDIKDFWRPLKL